MRAPIDLRSDTVTRPGPEMRRAMAEAEVGDDVYGEDPTVQRLEERTAEILGMPAALFVPSGTMGNQIALWLGTRRGDEVYVGEGAHCSFYESGAGAALAGVQFVEVGRGGLFSPDELERVVKPLRDYHPRPSLVSVENTHNRAGGKVFPQTEVRAVAALARSRGLSLHLDGARIWNAAVASGLSPAELAAPFDTASVCFSKGLGAPVGSALCGSADGIAEARRVRKMLGGGMRQAGVLAAAALFALERNRERLRLDHEAAAFFAARLAERVAGDRHLAATGVRIHIPETNVVLVDLGPIEAETAARAAAARGLLVGAMDRHRLRAVTHLDVPRERLDEAAESLGVALGLALDAPLGRPPERPLEGAGGAEGRRA